MKLSARIMLAALFIAIPLPLTVSASAVTINEGEMLYFDMGNTYEENWISVSAGDKYDSKKGYGFSKEGSFVNSPAKGQGILSDSVIWNNDSGTFNADVPDGMYRIGIYAGDIKRMSVKAEGFYAIMNMTDSGCYASAEIPVTDGQLNISVGSSTIPYQDTSYSVSAVTVTRLSENEARKKRVFIAGDSIASSYYPLDINPPLRPDYQGGWGQMLEGYLPSDMYVHNYATGGQSAAGFLRSGQFDAVEHFLETGDYVIIAFGINDQTASDEEEFKASVTEMVKRVSAKGGIPILLTNHGRLDDYNDKEIFYTPDRWYKQTAKQICDEYGIGYIDLHYLAGAYFSAIGFEDTAGLYWINWANEQDPLHVNRQGAGQLARLIVEEINRLGFNDFYSDKLPTYGISGDITLKCSGVYDAEEQSVKLIDFQNLKPSPQDILLIACVYNENGALSGSREETITLPPFDVLDVTKTTTVTIASNERAFMIKNGEITDLNNTSISYGYSTARLAADEILK